MGDYRLIPCAGIIRIRFKGYDLSPFVLGTPIVIFAAKINFLTDYCQIIFNRFF